MGESTTITPWNNIIYNSCKKKISDLITFHFYEQETEENQKEA